LNYSAQIERKTEGLRQLLGPHFQTPLEFVSFAEKGLRDRLDFVLSGKDCGLFSKTEQGVVDLADCGQLSPALQQFYQDFRRIRFPILKGSFRLRVGPEGQRGVWLDFANRDVKFLLDEDFRTLEQLRELAFVEIGQRHKALIRKSDGRWGLGDPQFHPWMRSTHGTRSVDLLSTVASFTQPSHVSNQWITQTLAQWFLKLQPRQVLEFGSGIGNLTLPALSYPKTRVLSLELEARAAEAQLLNLQNWDLQNRVDLRVGDFRRTGLSFLEPCDVLLVNPARNGVGHLFQATLVQHGAQGPRHVIYMSCYPESFALDTQILRDFGYSAERMLLVDQFPQTHHAEILSHWVRD